MFSSGPSKWISQDHECLFKFSLLDLMFPLRLYLTGNSWKVQSFWEFQLSKLFKVSAVKFVHLDSRISYKFSPSASYGKIVLAQLLLGILWEES